MFQADVYERYDRYFFDELHEESFVLKDGEGPVMLSAPHSVEQMRFGKPKFAEPQTGALVLMLHEALNCPVIYKTRNCGDDANFDEKAPYKDALMDYVRSHGIQAVLDLHQLSDQREVIVNLGTGGLSETGGFRNTKNMEFLNLVLASFTRRNVGKILIDEPFDGSGPHTVSTCCAQKCGILAMQVELNSDAVRFGFPRSKVEEIYEALTEIIQNLRQMLQGDRYEKADWLL